MLHFVINGCAGFDIFLFYFGSYTSLEHAWHVHIFARLRVYVSVRLSLSLSPCACAAVTWRGAVRVILHMYKYYVINILTLP